MKFYLKLTLLIILLFSLFNMPYGYYQFVRISCFVGFGLLAYWEYCQKKNFKAIIGGMISILFNPVFKIYFKKQVWQSIDICVASILIVSVFIEQINRRKLSNINLTAYEKEEI